MKIIAMVVSITFLSSAALMAGEGYKKEFHYNADDQSIVKTCMDKIFSEFTYDGDTYGINIGMPGVIRKNNVYGWNMGIFQNKAENVYGFGTGIFTNRAENFYGLMISALENRTEGMYGIQLGSFNIAKEKLNGVQLGIANIAEDSRAGSQNGLINVAKGDYDGNQLGLVNCENQASSGFQAGIVSYSKKLKGIQFGLINVNLNSYIPCLPIFNYAF